MTLTKERQGEIALEILKFRFQNDEKVPKAEETRRKIGNISKATGISKDELVEFELILRSEIADDYATSLRY